MVPIQVKQDLKEICNKLLSIDLYLKEINKENQLDYVSHPNVVNEADRVKSRLDSILRTLYQES